MGVRNAHPLSAWPSTVLEAVPQLLPALGPGPPCCKQVPGAWYAHRQPPRQQQWVADGRVGGGGGDQDANLKQGPLFSSLRPGARLGVEASECS